MNQQANEKKKGKVPKKKKDAGNPGDIEFNYIKDTEEDIFKNLPKNKKKVDANTAGFGY